MKLSIIIPVFNEIKTIEEIIGRAVAAPILDFEKEIIVIDDGSNDGTEIILENIKEKYNFLLLVNPKNSGKGAAIRAGLNKATGDWVLIQDADLEYDPNDYPRLLEVLNKNWPVIYGSRNLEKQNKGYWHYVLGVKFLNFLLNLLFGSRLTDAYTGYKVFSAPLLKSLNLTSQGFEFEAEVTARILKKGISIKEVPIHYYPRNFSQGKKIRSVDGLIAIWTIVKYRIK